MQVGVHIAVIITVIFLIFIGSQSLTNDSCLIEKMPKPWAITSIVAGSLMLFGHAGFSYYKSQSCANGYRSARIPTSYPQDEL